MDNGNLLHLQKGLAYGRMRLTLHPKKSQNGVEEGKKTQAGCKSGSQSRPLHVHAKDGNLNLPNTGGEASLPRERMTSGWGMATAGMLVRSAAAMSTAQPKILRCDPTARQYVER